ncbi:hypothetical protein ACE6H2_024645 [Prunus campanulata]
MLRKSDLLLMHAKCGQHIDQATRGVKADMASFYNGLNNCHVDPKGATLRNQSEAQTSLRFSTTEEEANVLQSVAHIYKHLILIGV